MIGKEASPEKKFDSPMTVEELTNRIKTFKVKIANSENKNLAIEIFLANLENYPERFKSIFQTEGGSIYFELNNGQSFRIKNNSGVWELQPICQRIFYVDERTSDEISDMVDENISIVGKKMKVSDCLVGAIPFEVGLADKREVIIEDLQEVENKYIVITKGFSDDQLDTVIHKGHKIINIIG